MNYIKITFNQLNKEQLLALEGLLSNEEIFLGNEINSKQLITYCNEADDPTEILKEIGAILNINYSTETIAEENWNAQWESSFNPIAIDNFVYIKADFHTEPAEHFEHIIHITPKMSFGTGHHDTTQLVIKTMKSINFNETEVFDFGTGTGVLAILAEKLGAKKVLGTDNDPWSIENSKENIKSNQTNKIEISDTDISLLNTDEKFDVILANINRQILLKYMSNLKVLMKQNGQIILSGFLTEDLPIIEKCLADNNINVKNTQISNNWVCIHATNN